ncbi:MAG: hypothetical protein A2161_08950 [Candidatus Schekmanbacteria bacterium RBG_13_48_7]|uniref:Uncharacterized protein n=1 Tax=Candidatus Schekmanbacteria bacterium RBG_13_48_7 TaxID=1817878 RepID=A0A1F7RN65_9BACT|nr:MAG: hypothetical protein A2161_08950 [Candidatus Schekmanbacteria bacterium RBG_13_48_7]
MRPFKEKAIAIKGLPLVKSIEQNYINSFEGDMEKINEWADFLGLSDWFEWTDFENVPYDYTQSI